MERNQKDSVDILLMDYFGDCVYNVPEFILSDTKKTIMGLTFKRISVVEVIKRLIITLITVALLSSGVYAGVKYVADKKDYDEVKIEKKEMSWFGSGELVRGDTSGVTLKDGIFYKKIDNYDEYLKFSNEFNSIPEMVESDFNEYFLVIFIATLPTRGLYVDNVEVTQENLKFTIRRNVENEDVSSICTKISREKNRESIEVEFLPEMSNVNDYMNIDEIPYDYTREQAIADGCVVLLGGRGVERYSKVIAGQKKLDEFIENAENGINGNIRIVEYETSKRYRGYEYNPNGAYIVDIEFNNGKYIVSTDIMRAVFNPEQYDDAREDYKVNFITDKIEVHEDGFEQCTKSYFLNSMYGENAQVVIAIVY